MRSTGSIWRRSAASASRNRLEKFYVEPRDAFTEPLPLGAIYVLREARPPHAPGIERPNIVDGGADAAAQCLSPAAGEPHGAEDRLFPRGRDHRQRRRHFPSDAGPQLRADARGDRLAGAALARIGLLEQAA